MIKAIGQTGLNFIANKFKELKVLVDKKADKSEIKTKLSELTGDSTHRTVTDTEKSNWDNKVDKVAGKGLSANDYDSTAKTKVDAIPINPKYTDTVTEVVDNLTTNDATKALSAKQGKALQDNKADKSDISRCKTDGYNTSTVWGDISSTRDLEDWIGDFDKRTRELKNGGGGTIEERFFGRDNKCVATKMGNIVIMYIEGKDFFNAGRYMSLPVHFFPSTVYFRNASQLSTGLKEIAFNCGSGTFVSILSDGTVRLMSYGRNANKDDAFAANIVYFTD